MSIDAFVECCEDGGFLDSDGIGEYVKDNKMTGVYAHPSHITSGLVRRDADGRVLV